MPQTPSTPSAPSTQTTRTTCPPGTPAGELCYTPLEPLPGNIDESGKPGSFGSLLNGVFRILISLGGLVAVLALVIGGITYMVSDIADKKEQARKRISGALWGLLILISSVLILQTINPQLLNFNFGPSGNAGGAATTNTSATQTNSTSNTTVESSGVITIKSNDQSGSALLQSFTSKCAGSVSKKGSSVEENFTRDTYECVK
ncbi:hypothetical protein HYS79_00685 [Patescibacteria group bacterium]|nr:hypothetical protein [Patescibacteria group bacterium]